MVRFDENAAVIIKEDKTLQKEHVYLDLLQEN